MKRLTDSEIDCVHGGRWLWTAPKDSDVTFEPKCDFFRDWLNWPVIELPVVRPSIR